MAAKIARYQRLVAIGQDASEAMIGCFLERGIDFFGGRGFFEIRDQVDDGNGRRWDPKGDAIESAAQFRNDKPDGSGGPSRRGHDVHRRRTGPSEVSVHQVQNALIVGV